MANTRTANRIYMDTNGTVTSDTVVIQAILITNSSNSTHTQTISDINGKIYFRGQCGVNGNIFIRFAHPIVMEGVKWQATSGVAYLYLR